VIDGEDTSTVARQQARLADVAVADDDTFDRPTYFRRRRHFHYRITETLTPQYV